MASENNRQLYGSPTEGCLTQDLQSGDPYALLSGKRVLFVLPWLELGGAERQALHLATHLQSIGCTVAVWGLSETGGVTARCEEAGIPWESHRSIWPLRKKHWSYLPWRATRFLAALRNAKPDIILPYCLRPCIACGSLWRQAGAQVCIWGQRDVITPRGDPITRFAYRNSSAIICNASHEVNSLHRCFGDSKAPVLVVHNGVGLEPAERTAAEWRTHLGIAADAVVVTMLANFRRDQKRHDSLLRAWRQLLNRDSLGKTRPELVLAGAHSDSFSDVRALAEELGVLDTVHFPGHVKDVRGLLEASDIGVLLSPNEGLSNAVLEYMTCGLPVVATDNPGNSEALGPIQPLNLCPAESPAAIASALSAFVSNPKLRSEVGASNLARARAEFSMAAMNQRMVEGIAGVLCKAEARVNDSE